MAKKSEIKSGKPYDVIIVGGGPAGLSAALILGRSCRRVLVFDTGRQRNRFSGSLNGYLTRDRIAPKDFLQLAREDLKPYPVEFRNKEVVNAAKKDDTFFWVRDESGKEYSARKILLATGVADNIPDIPGIEQFYGKSVHHCPY